MKNRHKNFFNELKVIVLIIIGSLFFSNISFAQNQYELEWSNNYDTSLESSGSNMNRDSEGNIIITGSTFENGNRDFLVIKYTPGGTLLWSQVIGMLNGTNDRITSFFIDSSDNIFLSGVGVETINSSKSIVVKLNTFGDILWVNEYSDDFIASESFRITGDNLGNTFVTGFAANIFPIKMIVYKLDTNGNLSWVVNYSSDDSTIYYGRNIRIVDNTIIALGTASVGEDQKIILLKYNMDGELLYSNETFFDDGSFNVNSHIDHEANIYIGLFGNFKVIKFDPLGNEQWQFEVPTNLPENVTADKVNDIITDQDGNVYVTGRHHGENYGDPDNYTNGNLQVNKISSEGNQIYSYRYENIGTNTGESGNTLYLGNNGYLAIGGSSGSSADTESEFLAVVLDQQGQLVELLKDYEAGSNNSISSVILDEDLNLYVTGTANSKAKTQQYLFTGELSTPNFTAVENKIAPYPNPFSNSLEIEGDTLSGLVEFTLYNANGAVVLQNSFEGEINETINTSSLPNGFYFYTIVNGDVSNSGKLIKK